MNPKIIIALLALVLIGVYFAFDLQQYLNLQTLKDQKDALAEFNANNPITMAAAYFFTYVIFTALALPAAAILTLAGGAVFGFWQGLILVSFASSIGATCAFLLTRYLFHDAVEKKFGQRLVTINKGIEAEGAFYVFGLRLVPLFPFFVINSVLALTKLKTFTFYWASQLGMLAGTVVYVNAGTQLAEIEDKSDIVSLELVLSFVLLGLFPIIAKHALSFLRQTTTDETVSDQPEARDE